MRRRLLVHEAGRGRPREPTGPLVIDGVTVLEQTATTMKLVVDTSRTSIRAVLDVLLDGPSVADISVVDPPLEQVISEIYGLPHP